MVSQRILKLQPSLTLALDAKVKQLQKQGIPIINLSLGEPDFKTPENISKAAIKVINEGFTHYTPAAGILELREAILINSPSNPTGSTINEQELKRIANLAIKHNIFVISDEIYEKILYKGKHVSIASFGEKIKKLTISVNGFSKAYAMTGWRIGYAAGCKEIIGAMVSFCGQTNFLHKFHQSKGGSRGFSGKSIFS